LIAEINRVRGTVMSFSADTDALDLPEAIGPVVTLSEKQTIPVKEHPEVLPMYLASWRKSASGKPST